MKYFNKLLVALCLALALCLAAQVALPVSLNVAPTALAASSVKLDMTKATIYNGSTLQLKLTGAMGKVTWTSSAKSVATVNDKGLVTAKKVGSANITAKTGGKSYVCKLTVKSPLAAEVTKLTLEKGKSKDIKITWQYIDKLNVKWDNANVATVKWGTWEGKTVILNVKALAAGTTTITVSNVKTKDTVKIKLTVQDGTSQKQEIGTLMGLKVAAANKKLEHKLKGAQIGYVNDYFSVRVDSFKRINNISLYGGKGRYRLMSVYPGMKSASAVKALKKQGWKKSGHDTAGDLYISAADPAHAIRLEVVKGRVACVTYFIPGTEVEGEL